MMLSRKNLIALALGTATVMTAPIVAADVQVVELTKVPCQFLESENGQNHVFSSSAAADRTAINERTEADRLAQAKVLGLKSGAYVFRVTNHDVPYELVFWLRGEGLIARAKPAERLRWRSHHGNDT